MKTAKTKPPKSVSRFTLHESASASALILAVVLTSLLAIIGVMFVMIARVDKMATSAISENKELNFAVEAVVAKISQELVLDVPGVAGAEYYDYPGEEDKWLASLEPYDSGGYKWRRISDVYNKLGLSLELPAEIIPDYQGSSDVNEGEPADADGDGVADSNWVIIPDMTSNKGKPIYAAIRIIDNGGMLNVNTAYKFDPNVGPADVNLIDGSSQTQINLLALSERGSTSNPLGKLDDARFGDEPLPHNLNDYIRNVVWRYNEPNGLYTPFDISDELKLRNRYILNYNLMTSRIEGLWTRAYDGGLGTPRTDQSQLKNDPNYWFWKTNNSSADVNQYDYRHISTTYNMDRIIDPNSRKMTNINTADVNALYNSIRKGLLDANYIDVNIAAQIAVNITDYRDSDSDVTVYPNPDDGRAYYGFERPCIYISELAHRFQKDVNGVVYRSYAVELYKPYTEDDDPCDWLFVIDGISYTAINWSEGSKHFCVMQFEDPCTPPSLSPPLLTVTFDPDPNYGHRPVEPGYSLHFNAGSNISLLRPVYDVNGVYLCHIVVDSKDVPAANPATGWLDAEDGVARSIQRDITLPKCIRRLWNSDVNLPTLGQQNIFTHSDSNMIQAHPANTGFTNVGEIGMLFRKPAYYEDGQPVPLSGVIGYSDSDTEEEVRVDLADPNFQQLFKYLTVFDPYNFHPGDANYVNETRIKGRININTAPWFVLAQLPWVSQRIGGTDYSLAQAIASYRDTVKGFKSIGELIGVAGMDYYKTQTGDLAGFPDLTPGGSAGDGAPDDFEERDVIFARISNLVTVRSDVFTAYILVRIGTDGPQKRVMAILDRSNVYPGDGKVRIVALHPVPDPR
jgi:DNA uptake protein ComE-like DNA-binding protein